MPARHADRVRSWRPTRPSAPRPASRRRPGQPPRACPRRPGRRRCRARTRRPGTRARPTCRTTATYSGSCTVSISASVAGGGETMVTAVSGEHAELAGQFHGQPDPAPGRRDARAPKSYRVSASSHTTAVDPLTGVHLRARTHHSWSAPQSPGGRDIRPSLVAAELAAAVAGRLDRREERGAHPVLLKLADRRDRRAGRGRHRLPQDDRVLARSPAASSPRRTPSGSPSPAPSGAACRAGCPRRPSPRPGSTRTRARSRTARSPRPAAYSGIRITLPTGASSSSARRRCSSAANDPAEITDIASSTSTGVLDITRTTGTSTGKRRSMNEVVIPAATEITSCDGATEPGDLVEHPAHVLRLDREHQGLRLLRGLGGGRAPGTP